MAKLTKRKKLIREKVDFAKTYAMEEAIALLKELSKVKFSETVDVAVNLGIDPRKSDQNVRGATSLPHGTGKDVSDEDITDAKIPLQIKWYNDSYVKIPIWK